MTSRHLTPAARAAAIADYKASGDSYAVVAARHGMSRTHLHALVNPGKKRARKQAEQEEVALTGGTWVRDGLVMRWQPFIAPSKANLSDRERRVEWEDAMFDVDEARDLHARYFNGCREPRTVVGERVYQRRKKRAQYARRKAA